MLGAVQMRHIKADNDLKLRGEALRNAIEEDKAKGLIPFFVSVLIFEALAWSKF